MELAYLFRAIMRRKWIILLCVALALAIAIFFTKDLKKNFKSVAQLSTGFTESEITGTNQSVNYLQSELNFNNAKENITSPKVLSLVSYHLLLHDLQSDQPFTTLSPKQKNPITIDKQATIIMLAAHLDSLNILSPSVPEEKKVLNLLDQYNYDIETLGDELKVDRYLKSDYINIEYSSENPNLSAFVVNTLCDEFKRFYGLKEKQRTTLSISNLDSLVKQKKSSLDQKQGAREHYMASRGVLDANLEGSNKLNQITTFENLLIMEQGIQKSMSYRVRQLDSLIHLARSKGLTSITAPTGISQADNSEFLKLRQQYNSLYNEYVQKGMTDPDIKKRLDQLTQSMRQLNIVETYTARPNDDQSVLSVDQLTQRKIDAQAQLEESNQKIGSVESKLTQLRGGLTGIATASAAVQQYDKEIQIASAEYTSAKDQLNNALNFNETKPENFKQTLVGQPALKPEPSKRLLIVFSAGIAAFLVSCFVISILELIDQTIKTPTHFQDLSNLPLIGIINQVKLRASQNVLEKVANLDEAEKQRDNTFLELLRKLRYEIESSNKKTFLFTSTKPQQGKTTLIQALSYILSLGKKRVLIIDTNFCDNELTKRINASPVLEKIDLDGKPFNKEDLNEMITKTIVQDVDIIGCQGGDYTPSEILPRNHLLNHLNELKASYDYIFLEGAPLNEFSDTKELLPYVEGLIAVFSSESDFTAADKESIKFLEENRDKFIGAILNKVEDNNLEL
jgi:uncharacterized protein involved in exopolysaccharide biosynthesis/Mrp family chromosome partitioning ATPase